MQHRQKSGSSLGVAAPLLLEGGDEEDDPAKDPVPTAAATNIKLVAFVSVMVVLLGVSDRIAYKVPSWLACIRETLPHHCTT